MRFLSNAKVTTFVEKSSGLTNRTPFKTNGTFRISESQMQDDSFYENHSKLGETSLYECFFERH